ncbi:Uncharacterised protein [Streptococcus porcinus]|uniref:hypothetical protein n=1 Tax=Streptococcus porcinus TaxID=1340 RepID=UPI0010CAC51C|nr:hypothetical protein [Streptococcus porcinus]VTS39159.1 Uncharacterised protein [Streptococcus porcinus]
MKKTIDPDELIAESFQMENYIMQRLHYKNNYSPIVRDIDNQLSIYLSYYSDLSVQLQFQIFLYSRFFAQKVSLKGIDIKKNGGGEGI